MQARSGKQGEQLGLFIAASSGVGHGIRRGDRRRFGHRARGGDRSGVGVVIGSVYQLIQHP